MHRVGLLSCASNLDRNASITGLGEQDANLVASLVRSPRPKSPHSMPSATGGIARLVCSAVRGAGISLKPVLSKAGLTVEQIDNRNIRVTAGSQIRLLELAADALQDDLPGIHLARDYDLREIGLLYYVSASSDILNEALHRVIRNSRIANEGVGRPWVAGSAGASLLKSASGTAADQPPQSRHVDRVFLTAISQ
jgi:Arabinose-binding domain of AraC transcription regulator, N-term